MWTNRGIIVLYLLISVNLAQYQVFRGESCNFWQGWYKNTGKLFCEPFFSLKGSVKMSMSPQDTQSQTFPQRTI